MRLRFHQDGESVGDARSIGRTPTAAIESRAKWILVLAPIGYLWFRLISNLSVEWTTNPQYSYGWVVPFLCIAFLLQRWQTSRGLRDQNAEVRGQQPEAGGSPASVFRMEVLFFAALAFLYLPTRFIEEATPEWRPIQWALGIEAVGLTLCAIYLAKGRGWLRQVAFPLCFFFVAIPWPSPVEAPIVQSLTRISSALTVELLGWIGIPAIQHGNLIEVSTGTVGVSEACSGIRSFQTSLMVSLFFGEFYGFGLWRRFLLIPTGFILAMAFNVCRMSFLTTVAAKRGVAAIGRYHDPAGVMIAVACTVALWGMAMLMKRREKKDGGPQMTDMGKQGSGAPLPVSALPFPHSTSQRSALFRFSLILLGWLVLVEAGAELWYRGVESHLAPSAEWSILFPTNDPTFHGLPISAETKNLLRFDEGEQGAWVNPDGRRFEAFYFNWRPGRVAGYLAKRHTPEVCLPAAGYKMVSGPELTVMNINGVALPVRSYVFESDGEPMYVFACRWEAGVNANAYVEHEATRFNLVRGIWAGRGKNGQKVLEIIISGCPDFDQAKAALMRQLQTMIKVKTPQISPRVQKQPDHNG